ncbi:MAG: S-layer homology domain-containing protein [Acidimicrobiia bacterium]|nr:S-layer homology domain-containing protein [Acidimicrobiia bacterium]MDH4307147.1 S-layer homology domain-containing protein [Acidimicrobiia bacterium]
MSRNRLTRLAAMVGVLMIAPVAAYAIHGFTDVPDSNVFHDDISWLSDAEVTKGCNPPTNDQFCPSDNVTREQMAAFMRRLAENQVVDAGTVGGKGSGDLVRVATDRMPQSETVTSGVALSTQIEAPAGGGVLLMNAAIPVFGNATDDVSFSCTIYLNGDQILQGGGYGQYDAPQIQDTCALSSNATVPEGTHTVEVRVSGSDAFFQVGALNVVFVGIGADGGEIPMLIN